MAPAVDVYFIDGGLQPVFLFCLSIFGFSRCSNDAELRTDALFGRLHSFGSGNKSVFAFALGLVCRLYGDADFDLVAGSPG